MLYHLNLVYGFLSVISSIDFWPSHSKSHATIITNAKWQIRVYYYRLERQWLHYWQEQRANHSTASRVSGVRSHNDYTPSSVNDLLLALYLSVVGFFYLIVSFWFIVPSIVFVVSFDLCMLGNRISQVLSFNYYDLRSQSLEIVFIAGWNMANNIGLCLLNCLVLVSSSLGFFLLFLSTTKIMPHSISCRIIRWIAFNAIEILMDQHLCLHITYHCDAWSESGARKKHDCWPSGECTSRSWSSALSVHFSCLASRQCSSGIERVSLVLVVGWRCCSVAAVLLKPRNWRCRSQPISLSSEAFRMYGVTSRRYLTAR